MRYLAAFLIISSCAKSRQPIEKIYTPPPEIEWDEDIDLEDLPEANDTGEVEDL